MLSEPLNSYSESITWGSQFRCRRRYTWA